MFAYAIDTCLYHRHGLWTLTGVGLDDSTVYREIQDVFARLLRRWSREWYHLVARQSRCSHICLWFEAQVCVLLLLPPHRSCEPCMLDPSCGFCYRENGSAVFSSSCEAVNGGSTERAAWGRWVVWPCCKLGYQQGGGIEGGGIGILVAPVH